MLIASCLPNDEVAVEQAALWLGLADADGASCPLTLDYELPRNGARATLATANGVGKRQQNSGDSLVECSVTPSSGSSTEFNVNLRVSSSGVGDFFARGTLTKANGGELQISVDGSELSLQQLDCTAQTPEVLIPGALWIKRLHCPDVGDVSLDTVCDVRGGLLFEHCDH